MKNIKQIIISLLITTVLGLNAQVAINTEGSDADASAILDVKSTEKGFLPPRMTESQRRAISSPAAGLVVWCSNCGGYGELQVFNGLDWTNMIGGMAATSISIGDYFQGGVVCYIFQVEHSSYIENETHGLILNLNNQSNGAEWGCYGIEISGADGQDLGSGYQNTIDIEAECTTAGTAADMCANLLSNGYDDWFLPSYNTLKNILPNLAIINASLILNGGTGLWLEEGVSLYYWSSSEYNADRAWGYRYYSDTGGGGTVGDKNNTNLHVRAIRAF